MTRINDRIRAPEVRVVYKELNLVLPTRKALAKAKELGLDLVEIAANADPPVCRIVDYGKYKYDQSKQKKEKPKSSTKIKEVKFRVRIEEHDYRIKMARAEDFLDHGNKLRVQLQFRGRENAHRELGFELMDRVKEDLKTMAKVDVDARLSGRQITMMLSPLSEKQRQRKFKKVEIPDDYEEEDFDDDDDDDDVEGQTEGASSDAESGSGEDEGKAAPVADEVTATAEVEKTEAAG